MYPAISLPVASENITPNKPRYRELMQMDMAHNPKTTSFIYEIKYNENIIRPTVNITPIINLTKYILV